MSCNIFQALREHFAPPEYAYIEELRSRTGFSGPVRYLDGLAVSCYASRGYHIHGVEVKVSRGDWLAELRSPAKAEVGYRFCHHWWLAVSDPDIVQNDLPPTWGLLVPRGGRLVAAVRAPTLKPGPLSVPFLASLLRNVSERYTPTASIQDKLDAARSEGRKDGEHCAEVELARAQKEVGHYKSLIENFKAQTGVDIHAHNLPQLREAYQLASMGPPEQYRLQLERLQASLGGLLAQINAHVEDVAKFEREHPSKWGDVQPQ